MKAPLVWSVLLAGLTALSAAPLRVATFRADVTPRLGEPLIWFTPAAEIMDPLWAKGVILEDGGSRYVLCAVDWCGIGGSTHAMFRRKIAEAAGTTVSHVVVHSVHQHTAPYVDGDAYQLLGELTEPPKRMTDAYLADVTDSLAAAVRKAIKGLKPFDAIGTSQARVNRVASARRISINGELITRFSTSGRDPKMAELPEGAIDPYVKTITFASKGKPVARMHYYATHPQTFCCDGRVTADFAGAAREAVERRQGVFQVYFTGCAGDVTVGKYNDGSDAARKYLQERLQQGLVEASSRTRLSPVSSIRWRTAALKLPPKPAPEWRSKSGTDAYRAALGVAFAARKEAIEVSALEIGNAVILHLPGEPMLEYQKYAQRLSPNAFVAVAGYGDITPGYLCTDRAQEEGGYEPSASYAAPGSEAELKRVIRELLGQHARAGGTHVQQGK